MRSYENINTSLKPLDSLYERISNGFIGIAIVLGILVNIVVILAAVDKENFIDISRYFLFGSVSLTLLIIIGYKIILKGLFESINKIVEWGQQNGEMPLIEISPSEHKEVADIYKIINQTVLNIRKAQNDRLEAEHNLAVQDVYRNLAHDIRSPLSALNMVLAVTSELPEENRMLIRNSVQRINDIANGLLEKKRNSSLADSILLACVEESNNDQNSIDEVMLYSLVDTIVSEKRMEYRCRAEIDIQVDLHNGFSLFTKVPGSELTRLISNLINNSVEAIDRKKGNCRILVSLKKSDNFALIEVKDNGIGLPDKIKNQFGTKGLSVAKTSGNGLGIYQAVKFAKANGGTICFRSNNQAAEVTGTTISIHLPLCKSPQWFLDSIDLKNVETIISVDDESSVHEIWKERIKQLFIRGKSVQHIIHYSGQEFINSTRNSFYIKKSIVLIDYEFIGQSMNGLDIIEKYHERDAFILVTSRHDEKGVQERAKQLGVKILPKVLAPIVLMLNCEKIEQADIH